MHADLPWPTELLREAIVRLQSEQRITPAVAASAPQKLSTWLSRPAGAVRTWCRETRPRTLAACALLRASREEAAAAAAAAAAGSGLIVGGEAKEAMAPIVAAIGAGVGSSDEAAAGVEAALAALPAGH